MFAQFNDSRVERFLRRALQVALIAATTCLSAGKSARATLIDVDFNGGNDFHTTPPDHSGTTFSGAAVLGQAGDIWNGIQAASASSASISLNDSTGAASVATLDLSAAHFAWEITADGTNGINSQFASSPYKNLMYDYFGNRGPITLTLHNLTPNGSYNFVLYTALNIPSANSGGTVTINAATQSYVIQDAVTTLAQGDNYVMFNGVTANNSGDLVVSIARTSGGEIDLDGFQIQSIPEPTSIALLGVGTAGLLVIGRRRRVAADRSHKRFAGTSRIVLVMSVCALAATGAQASILTFDISTSSAGTAVPNNSNITTGDQDYGDNITATQLISGVTDANTHFYRYGAGNGPTPDITVSYNTFDNLNSHTSLLLSYNQAPYNRGTYINENLGGSVTSVGVQYAFTPSGGFKTQVNSFDVLSDNSALQSGNWTVFAGSTSGPVLASGTWSTSSTVLQTVDVSSAGAFDGVEILQVTQTGGGPRDTGYDNVNFSQTPEPGSLLLLTIGVLVAGLGWLRRRRRA